VGRIVYGVQRNIQIASEGTGDEILHGGQRKCGKLKEKEEE
jgi:hypothetical protein